MFFFKSKFFFEIKAFSNKNRFSSKKVSFSSKCFFEAFHLTLVKKNRQNRERKKGAAIEKSRAVIGWKRMDERASHVYICTIFELYTNCFCRQRAGLEVLIKVALKSK